MDLDWLERIGPTLAIAGRAQVGPTWQQPLRVIYDHELMLFGPGDGFLFVLNGREISCPGNSYLIVPPGVWHSGRRVGEGNTMQCWVHFDWIWHSESSASPVMTFAPAKPQEPLFRKAPDYIPNTLLYGTLPMGNSILEQQVLVCDHFNQGSARQRVRARSEFLALLGELLVPPQAAQATNTRRDAQLQHIRTVLQELANEPFTRASSIRDALGELGQSYDNQARLFKRAFGITPLHYVNLVRIERAKCLLQESTSPAADIAAQLGFRDAVYFGKLFRKITGKTPVEFRNS